ncbi:hypothetical protein SAMN02745866_03892 [Alteromonadaceae bacterium Bs31]|nr:hypothetical protein SAMN02745866_03892 [Alteromonadaceae bacterium Bs31]
MQSIACTGLRVMINALNDRVADPVLDLCERAPETLDVGVELSNAEGYGHVAEVQ